MTTTPSIFTRRHDGLGSLFREIERSFDDFSRRGPLPGFANFGSSDMMMPKLDVSESKDGLEVTAELPGCDEKDIDVTLSEGVLTIRGEKKSERNETAKDRNWHMVERSYGSFSRSLPLPFTPDPAGVEAKFDNGVLHVKLPKPAEVAKREKKIEIRGSSPKQADAGQAGARQPDPRQPDPKQPDARPPDARQPYARQPKAD